LEQVGAYYQLADLKSEFVKFEAHEEIDASSITATCLVRETDDELALLLLWRSWQKDKSILKILESANDNKSLDRIVGRLGLYRRRLGTAQQIAIELKDVPRAFHRDFTVTDCLLTVESKTPEEQISVKTEKQEIVLSMFFKAPSGKRVGISYLGFPLAAVGEVTELTKVVQNLLNSISGLQPFTKELSLVESRRVDDVDFKSEKRTVTEDSKTTALRLDLKTPLSNILTRVNQTPWLQRRYAVELVALWTTVYWQLFSTDWRLTIPVPLLALLATAFRRRPKRLARDRSVFAGRSQRITLWTAVVGLVASQSLAILAVPSDGPSAVLLWLFLSCFQIRVLFALAQRHIRAVREAVHKYLEPDTWNMSSDANRYLKSIEVLRGRGPSFGGSSPHTIEAEGQSQIHLLLRLFYGVIGAISVILTYFAIGERFPNDGLNNDFIFQNNEGFTAALALLIIVISTVAVQMFTDLATTIREEQIRFERDVSKLAIGLSNYESGLVRVWGHIVDFLPEVSRSMNVRFGNLWREMALKNPEMCGELHRQVVIGGRPEEVENSIRQQLKSRLVPQWLSGGFFDTGDESGGSKRLTRILTTRLSSEWGQFSQNLYAHASIPSDEKVFFLSFNALSTSFPEEVSALRQEIEMTMTALKLRASRYLDAVRKPEVANVVIGSCDNLDIDASYFLDDATLFDEIVGSAGSETDDRPKSQIRGQYSTLLRDAEYARVLYFASWLAQANSNVETRLHKVLEIRPPTRSKDKVSYTVDLLSNEVPQAFRAPMVLKDERIGEFLRESDQVEMFRLLIQTSLSNSQSAIHCLVRAALARKRRHRLLSFETLADRWRPRRMLSLPIVPTYSDRVRHLLAFLEIPDRTQAKMRLRSVHEVLTLPVSEEERLAAAKWAFSTNKVDLNLVDARRLTDALEGWNVFCDRFGGRKEYLALTVGDLMLRRRRTKPSRTSDAEHPPWQTVGKTAVDEVRSWYEDNNLRWYPSNPLPPSAKNQERRLDRFHRYQCLLRLANGKSAISRSDFKDVRNLWKHLREIMEYISPGLFSLLEGTDTGDLTAVDAKSGLSALILKVEEYCKNPQNDAALTSIETGYFVNQSELNEWRKSYLKRQENLKQSDNFSLDLLGETVESDKNVSEDVF